MKYVAIHSQGSGVVSTENPAEDGRQVGCSWFQYIDAELPTESPYLYGLHPNAEIGFLTQTSEKLFRTLLEMQPRDSHAGDGAGITREEKVHDGYGPRWFGEPKACK